MTECQSYLHTLLIASLVWCITLTAHAQAPISEENSDLSQLHKQAATLYNDEKDKEAFALFLQLASKGYVPSIYMAGFMYEKGLGTSSNATAAVGQYKKAAAKGYSRAIFRLMLIGGDYSGRITFDRKDDIVREFLALAIPCRNISSGNAMHSVSVKDELIMLASDVQGMGVIHRYIIARRRNERGTIITIDQETAMADTDKPILPIRRHVYDVTPSSFRWTATYVKDRGTSLSAREADHPLYALQTRGEAFCNGKKSHFK